MTTDSLSIEDKEKDAGRRFGIFNFGKKQKEQRLSGHIDSSLFAYLTPLMITVALIVLTIIVYSFHTLLLYFQTNVALNGLIIFLLSVSLFQTFLNNYRLYTTALFLKKIEVLIAKNITASDEDVHKLHLELENKIPLFNTKQMHNNINNLKIFGHPNFSDNDARIIKSKLGYRIRLRRSDVSFNAGILVMLGLLGTFLGLLKTIDAVGEAMSGMSNLGGDSGEINAETMSTFISSLSAPLQGMGLAFSSSLFGLSGSLLIGFFNHLCGGAQDNFIEAASRWIDNRIPSFTPEKEGGKDGDETAQPATKDDLQTWLAGYVHLSTKTNTRIAYLSQAIHKSLEQSEAVHSTLGDIATGQNHVAEQFKNTARSLDHLTLQHGQLIENSQHITQAIHGLTNTSSDKLSEMSTHIHQMTNTLDKTLKDSLEQSNKTSQTALNKVAIGLEKLGTVTEKESRLIATTLKDSLNQVYKTTQQALDKINTELAKLGDTAKDKSELETLQKDVKSVEQTLLKIHTKELETLQTITSNQIEPQSFISHLSDIEKLLKALNKQNVILNKNHITVLKKLVREMHNQNSKEFKVSYEAGPEQQQSFIGKLFKKGKRKE